MRKVVYVVFLFLGVMLYGQSDRFRRDYNYVSLYKNGKWGEWKEGKNTFVFNANDNNDIVVYMASGEKEVFRKVTKVEKDKNNSGEKYQALGLIDEEGGELVLMLYDNGSLKLVYSEDYQIQFEP